MRSCLRIDVPAELDIYKASERLVKQLARYPHLCLKMEPAAQDYFDGYSAMFNIRGKQLRRYKSADKSAEEGIAPWKIGMLAACLYLWDVMWEVSLAAMCCVFGDMLQCRSI